MKTSLHFIRTKDKKELDFAVQIVEVKLSDGILSRNFSLLQHYYPETYKIQLVKNLRQEKTYPGGEEVRRAANYLANLNLKG